MLPGIRHLRYASTPQLVALLAVSCTLIAWDSQDTRFTIQFLDTKRT